jgi:hypothetical protein
VECGRKYLISALHFSMSPKVETALPTQVLNMGRAVLP